MRAARHDVKPFRLYTCWYTARWVHLCPSILRCAHSLRRPREEAGMTSPDQMEAGPRAAAISNMMVRLLREYTGRGPTRARTTIGDDLIVCLLADTLTTSE